MEKEAAGRVGRLSGELSFLEGTEGEAAQLFFSLWSPGRGSAVGVCVLFGGLDG